MRTRRAFTMVELIIVMAIIAVVAAMAVPNLIEARKHANEASAIATLKTVSSCQTFFQERDSDGDGLKDYGSLPELLAVGLVDGIVGAGTKTGYTFVSNSGTTRPEYLFYVSCNPILMNRTGDRSFVINQEGVVYQTTKSPIPQISPLIDDAKPLPGMIPIR